MVGGAARGELETDGMGRRGANSWRRGAVRGGELEVARGGEIGSGWERTSAPAGQRAQSKCVGGLRVAGGS
jgi:hypothetical protein